MTDLEQFCRLCGRWLPPANVGLGVCTWCLLASRDDELPTPGYQFQQEEPQRG